MSTSSINSGTAVCNQLEPVRQRRPLTSLGSGTAMQVTGLASGLDTNSIVRR